MTTAELRVPRPGEPAPDFILPAVDREGTVSLADYKGRNALLLSFFRGLYCPFCRRQIARLGLSRDKLRAAGVETLGVVASDLERTRLYFRYRPTRVPLAVDPDLIVHRTFGIGKLPMTPQLHAALETIRTDAMGELPQPLAMSDAAHALNDKDRFEYAESDKREVQQQFPMDVGQFLLDRDGIVRWAHFEGLAIGQFPSEEELLALARAHGG